MEKLTAVSCCSWDFSGGLPMVWRHIQPPCFAAQPTIWWHNVPVGFDGREQKAEECEEQRRLLWIRCCCVSQLYSRISALTCRMVCPYRVYFNHHLCPNVATSAWSFPQSLFTPPCSPSCSLSPGLPNSPSIAPELWPTASPLCYLQSPPPQLCSCTSALPCCSSPA